MGESELDWLPDWRDASAYPSANTMKPNQWAWEFLRRNPDYQKAREDAETSMMKYEVAQKFGFAYPGLSDLPPPARNNRTIAFGWYLRESSYYSGNMNGAWLEDDNEVAFVFRIDEPIEQQIQQAKARLQNLQDHVGLIEEEKRLQVDKYRSYLRILDAAQEGVPLAEIAKVLYPNESNEYDAGFPVTDRVRKRLLKATELRDGGYVGIANGIVRSTTSKDFDKAVRKGLRKYQREQKKLAGK